MTFIYIPSHHLMMCRSCFYLLDIYCFRFAQLCQIPFKSLFTFVVLCVSGEQISLIFVKHIKLWIRSLYKFISINRITQENSSVLPKLEATLTIDLQGYLSRWCYWTLINWLKRSLNVLYCKSCYFCWCCCNVNLHTFYLGVITLCNLSYVGVLHTFIWVFMFESKFPSLLLDTN